MLAAVVVAGPIVIGLIGLGVLPGLDEQGSAPFWTAVSVVYYGLPVAVALAVGWSKPGGVLRASGFRATPAVWVFGGASVGVLVAIAFNTAYSAFMTLAGLGPPEASMRVMEQLTESVSGGPAATAVSLVLVVLVAPLVEEVVFRGVLLSGMIRRFGSAAGIGITAAIFAAVHLDPWRTIPLAFLGVVLGFLAWQGRSVWPAFIAHGMVNGFAYVLALAAATG